VAGGQWVLSGQHLSPKKPPQGLKPGINFDAFAARLNRLLKKACLVGERPEKRTSVAKATTYFIVFIPGINPRSTTRMSFSAACEVVP
jgi:hypothetical protein